MEARQKLYQILTRHVPENAIHYCLDLWIATPFHFKVTRNRNSKLGDYRFDPRHKDHSISVNHGLNKYSFLITYVHEIAHLVTTERFGRKAMPHGKHWKATFTELMQPLLNDLVFPADVLVPLKLHLKNPAASTYSDTRLVNALRLYDAANDGLVPLSALDKGDIFEFNNMMYTRLELRRTRVLCLQADTRRKYLISKLAMVRSLKEKKG